MIHLDTNTLIRLFVKDDSKKATKVKSLLEREEEIFISDVVFPELEYVLQHQYAFDRNGILQIFKFLTSRSNIKLNLEIQKAIKIFERSKLDMADCIIVAYSFDEKLASFDEAMLKVPDVTSYW